MRQYSYTCVLTEFASFPADGTTSLLSVCCEINMLTEKQIDVVRVEGQSDAQGSLPLYDFHDLGTKARRGVMPTASMFNVVTHF